LGSGGARIAKKEHVEGQTTCDKRIGVDHALFYDWLVEKHILLEHQRGFAAARERMVPRGHMCPKATRWLSLRVRRSNMNCDAVPHT
jgi:hypothetical protein